MAYPFSDYPSPDQSSKKGQGTMRKAGKYGDTRATPFPEPTNPNKHKRQSSRVLSGKALPWDVQTVNPKEWLDPGWKLFKPRTFKRFSKS